MATPFESTDEIRDYLEGHERSERIEAIREQWNAFQFIDGRYGGFLLAEIDRLREIEGAAEEAESGLRRLVDDMHERNRPNEAIAVEGIADRLRTALDADTGAPDADTD